MKFKNGDRVKIKVAGYEGDSGVRIKKGSMGTIEGVAIDIEDYAMVALENNDDMADILLKHLIKE